MKIISAILSGLALTALVPALADYSRPAQVTADAGSVSQPAGRHPGGIVMNPSVTPGRRIMGRLAKGSDLLAVLEQHCVENNIKLGELWAIGAVSRARVGYYNQAEQKYLFLELNRPLEILSLVGNISLKDGKPFVHAHVTLGDEEGKAWGGHLASGTVVFACEFVIQEHQSPKTFKRGMDRETGLFLWEDFD